MTGQIVWAKRPSPARCETWFKARVRPGDSGRWATAWSLVAARAEKDLPDVAEQDGEAAADDEARSIVATLREAMSAGRRIVEREPDARETTVDVGPHEYAREVVLADRASQEEQVVDYRRQYLPGGLLRDDAEVGEWVAAHTPTEPVEADHPVVQWTGFDGRPRRRASGGSRELVELWSLADRLAKRYGWSRPSAVTFVLAGGVPAAPMLRIAARTGLSSWAASVTLTVHPDVPVAAVANAYRAAQRTLNGPGRARLVSADVSEAVVAATTTPGSWHQKHAAYMATRPGRRDERHDDDFRRVVERARHRLVGTGATRQRIRRLLAPAE